MASGILHGKTILIVEDDCQLRDPLVEVFEDLGCRVLHASNGHQGFKVAEADKIDVLITDVHMSGGDGVELLQRLKTLDYADLVVLLITGYSDLSVMEAYHLGAAQILTKPFDLDEIIAAVIRNLTPREVRWKGMGDSAKPARLIEQDFPTLAITPNSGSVTLGRRGIFLPSAEKMPPPGTPVQFKLRFASGPIPALEGTGVVRWVRSLLGDHLPRGLGLDFDLLGDGMRADIIRLSDELKLQSAIPRA